MIHSHLGELAALATAFCWTVSALSFETAGKRVGSLSVNLIRLPIAFVLLTLASTFGRGLPLPTDAPPRAWAWLAVSGFVGFVIGDLCLFRALVVLGARMSMLIMTLVPPFAALFSYLITGERLRIESFIGMAVTILGIGLAVVERRKGENGGVPRAAVPPAGAPRRGPPGARSVPGILLALGGTLGQAMGLVLSKIGMGDYNPLPATQIRTIAGMAGFSILFIVIGAWPRVADSLRNRGAMLNVFLGSFFGPFLGVSFSLLAVQNAKAGVAATIMAIVPVLIIPPSVLLLRERVTAREILGAFLAVGGVAMLFLLDP